MLTSKKINLTLPLPKLINTYVKQDALVTSRAKGLLALNGSTVLDNQRHGDIINSAIRLYRCAIMLGRISHIREYSVCSLSLSLSLSPFGFVSFPRN